MNKPDYNPPRADQEPKKPSSEVSKKEILRRLKPFLLALGLGGPEAILQGCAVHRPLKQDITHTERAPEDRIISKDLESTLNRIPLFSELQKNPKIDLLFEEDLQLYDQGILAAYSPKTFESLQQSRGMIKATPFEQLEPEDREAYESSIFHEVVHAQQDYELWTHFKENEDPVIPKWKVSFYYAHYEKDGEKKLRLGAELEAYYKQALYEEEKSGEINEGTLAGFFAYYAHIKRTPIYSESDKVRSLVQSQYDDLVQRKGLTPEILLEKHRNE